MSQYKFRCFRQSFDDRPFFGEPLLVPFYTSLNADISGTWKDIKKRFSFQFYLYFHIKNLKFSFHVHFKYFQRLCLYGMFLHYNGFK